MQLTPRAEEFSNLILKHFGSKIKHTHKECEECDHEHEEHEEKVEPTVEETPMTNKEKYSLDYSKWSNLEDEEKEKQAKQAKNSEEEEYKKMFGCFHDRRKERQLFEKSTREKLDAAERFKKEGNKFFQSKDYAKADVEYQKALIQFDYAFPDDPKEEKEMEKLQEQCHTNMALVKFYAKDYKECIHHCNLAIKLNKNASKARYRKACALLELHEYDQAQQEIKEGLELDPSNQDFVTLKQKVNDQNVKYEQKTEKIYKKIFESS